MSLNPQIFHNKEYVPVPNKANSRISAYVNFTGSLLTRQTLLTVFSEWWCHFPLFCCSWTCCSCSVGHACHHVKYWGFYRESDCWDSIPEKMWQWECKHTIQNNCSQGNCKSGSGNMVLKATADIYRIAAVNYHSLFHFKKAMAFHASCRSTPESMKNM